MTLFIFMLCLVSVMMLINVSRNMLLFRETFPRLTTYPKVSVLIPARNEAHAIVTLIESLKLQDYPDFEVFILDDDSDDETANITLGAIKNDQRMNLIQNKSPIPAGWLGKSWACQQLSKKAQGEILCFIDADVSLSPDAIRKSVELLQAKKFNILCPYPRQITTTFLSRLVQPLLQWSWMATLPIDRALVSPRTSLSVGNGQLLLIDTNTYLAIGGHSAVKAEILEDIEIVRTVKRFGGKGGVWDGSNIAQCTMYATNSDLISGYAKSLWVAFGSSSKGLSVALLLLLQFLTPFLLVSSSLRAVQSLAALTIFTSIASRLLIHIHFHYRLVDALFYPFSYIAFAVLMMTSCMRKSRGTLAWKARPIHG